MLRRLLQANKDTIRERKLIGLIQGGFQHCPIEVRVAIADHGIIRGAEHAPEVRKSDQITDDIEARIGAHRRGGSLLSLDTRSNDGMYLLTSGELERLQKFLLEQHLPRSAAEVIAEAPPTGVPHSAQPPARPRAKMPRIGISEPVAAPVQHPCSKCGSLSLRIQHGKYGYYFKCQDCDGNTSINTLVGETGRNGRIRKDGPNFYLGCPDSGFEKLFYTNPDPAR